MGEPMKNMFNSESLREVALSVQTVYPPFPVDAFLRSVMDETWDDLELKARGRKITENLGNLLPANYAEALSILEKALAGNPLAFFFPDFIEVYGQGDADWDISIGALARNTHYWSSEMAVRPFIIKQEERMMAQMAGWANHDNEHIRRLASEGCRPQLPWAVALPKFKENPTPVLPILEQLKADPSPYVRKSVANNLNDISKTHPEVVVKLAKEWFGQNKNTNWVVKHGCRTLLKKGNRSLLALFGTGDVSCADIDGFALDTPSLAIGEKLSFSFTVLAKKTAKVRFEYAIDYMKANGKRNRKVFKISEVSLKEKEKKAYTRKHSFADVSVRKHYPGVHSVTLIVNGAEQGTLDFKLMP